MSVKKKKEKPCQAWLQLYKGQLAVYVQCNRDPTIVHVLDAMEIYKLTNAEIKERQKPTYIRSVKRQTKQVINAIKKIWKTDSVGDNWLFTHWLLQKQLDEVREKKFTADVILKEYADCIIILTKFFMQIGLDPEKVVLQRLKERHQGKTEEIKAKYCKMWEEEQRRRK